MAPPNIRPLTPLKQIMPQTLSELGIADKIGLEQMRAIWTQVVGSPISGYTAVTGYAKGKLAVQIKELGWKEALEPQTGEIIQRINARLGQPLIQGITFSYHPLVKPLHKPKV